MTIDLVEVVELVSGFNRIKMEQLMKKCCQDKQEAPSLMGKIYNGLVILILTVLLVGVLVSLLLK